MAAVHHGTNGVNGASFPPARFSKVPESISVPVADEDGIADIDLELGDMIEDDPTELLTSVSYTHLTLPTKRIV